jgi:hypothetical protein
VSGDDAPGSLNAAHLWHVDVHQDQRRPELVGQLDRLGPLDASPASSNPSSLRSTAFAAERNGAWSSTTSTA